MEVWQWDNIRRYEARKIELLEQILATLKGIQFKSTERLPPDNQPMNGLDWERKMKRGEK